jgi:hypothetical protein
MPASTAARPVRTVQNGPTTLIDFQTKTTYDLSWPRFTTTLDKRLSGATIRRPEPSAWANLLFDHVPAEGLELGPAWARWNATCIAVHSGAAFRSSGIILSPFRQVLPEWVSIDIEEESKLSVRKSGVRCR